MIICRAKASVEWAGGCLRVDGEFFRMVVEAAKEVKKSTSWNEWAFFCIQRQLFLPFGSAHCNLSLLSCRKKCSQRKKTQERELQNKNKKICERQRTNNYSAIPLLSSLNVVPQWKDINGFKQMPRDVSLDPCRKAIQWWLLRYDVRVWFWGDDVSQESVLQSHCVSSSFNYKIVKYATLIPQRAKRDL